MKGEAPVPTETPLDILREAKRLLLVGGIIRKVDARDAKGNHVPWQDSKAVCFCSLTAIRRAALFFGFNPLEDGDQPEKKAKNYLRKAAGCISITLWNDRAANDEQIIAGFGKAIDAAEKDYA